MSKLTSYTLMVLFSLFILRINAQKKNDATKTKEIKEVVITALGIKREKKSLGYSSQQVKGNELSQVPTPNFLNNLSGKVAGLDIKSGTNFGGSTNIVLRGYKSILGDNQALFVVDGVPILNDNVNDKDQMRGRSSERDLGNSAADINPDDIESINVLKGAAATALYGSRAQNGAIVITTKKGKKNKALSVDFSTSLTVSNIDKSTFAKYQNEYGQGKGGWGGKYNGENYVLFTEDASFGPRFDPNKLVYHYDAFIPVSKNYNMLRPWVAAENGPVSIFETATSYKNNLALSGGGEDFTYRFSYGNTYSTDIMPNTMLTKNNFSGNASYDFDEKLNISFSTIFVSQNTKGRSITGYNGNLMSSFRQWWATSVDIKDQKELYEIDRLNNTWNIKATDDTSTKFWNNPYFTLYENYQNDERDRFAVNASLNYNLTEDASLLGRVARDGYTLKSEQRLAEGSNPMIFGVNGDVLQPSGYAVYSYDAAEYNYDFLANYKKDIEDFNLTGLVGSNLNVKNYYHNKQSTGGGLIVPGIYTLSNSKGALPLPKLEKTTKKIFGVFAQATAGYLDTYFLETTLRRDQSSALPKKHNSYWYPSVSTSVVFSNLIDNIDWLNFGKFRAAYAQVGSDTDANRLSSESFESKGSFREMPTMRSNPIVNNPELKPQRLSSIELGVNTQLFRNRLGFDLAWFQNKAFDQIVDINVSYAAGAERQFKNAGTLQTRGFEVGINATPIKTSNFRWDVDVNWSNPFTKVTELADGVENILIGAFQGGLSINAPKGQAYGTLWTSDFVYKNGQKVIVSSYDKETGKYNYSYDVTTDSNHPQGSFQADWIGGVRNSFRYKNISLSFLVDIKQGGKVFSLDQYYGTFSGLYPNTVFSNGWGNPARSPRIDHDNSISGGAHLIGVDKDGNPIEVTQDISNGIDQLPGSTAVYDASYVKLREVSLHYKIPRKVLSSLHLNSLSVGVIGSNLWIIHKNLPMADPESGTSSGNFQGFQSGVMPTTRNISFSIKANF